MTSGGHCDGDACGQIWELRGCVLKDALMWEKEEDQGRLRAHFLGIAPLCRSAAPWAQGLSSTSPHVPGLQPHPVPGVPWRR